MTHESSNRGLVTNIINKREKHEKIVYFDRAVGRYRDHRNSGGNSAARAEPSTQQCIQNPMYQQHEADRNRNIPLFGNLPWGDSSASEL